MTRDGNVSFELLEEKVLAWGEQRGIFRDPNPQAQLLKTLEELGEVASALAKNQPADLVDGIGDVLVTQSHGLTTTPVDAPDSLGTLQHRRRQIRNHAFLQSHWTIDQQPLFRSLDVGTLLALRSTAKYRDAPRLPLRLSLSHLRRGAGPTRRRRANPGRGQVSLVAPYL